MAPTTGNAHLLEVPPVGTLNMDMLDRIKKDVYIQGKSDARILFIQYGDITDVTTKNMYDAGDIKNLAEKYGNDMSFIFKHHPNSSNQFAIPVARAAECVGKSEGSKAYYSFIDALLALPLITEESIEKTLVDMDYKVEDCIRGERYRTAIGENELEALMYTNGRDVPPLINVLINSKTGKYEVFSDNGWPQVDKFENAIERLLQN